MEIIMFITEKVTLKLRSNRPIKSMLTRCYQNYCHQIQKKLSRQKAKTPTRSANKRIDSGDDSETSKIDVAGIVEKIQDSENFTDIEKNILDKSDQLPRILLAGQFAHEHGQNSFTTGDIEGITDQLGMKIIQTNASKCIAKK